MERVLGVLDGAVLVVSAVEGVQPQTRVLMRALQRLRVPTLVFLNKLDRAGADGERVLRELSVRLGLSVAPAGNTPRLAEALAEHDDVILAAYVEDATAIPDEQLRDALARQTRRALVHPVFAGSALTGAGVAALTAGIAELLPPAAGDAERSASGIVFKIERAANGEKVAYVRMRSGTIRTRDRLRYGWGQEEKVTAIAVFEQGPAVPRPAVSAGEVAKLRGLHGIRIGDRVGDGGADPSASEFPPPTLESVVAPRDPADGARLRDALAQLAEQDPLRDEPVPRDDRVPRRARTRRLGYRGPAAG